MELLQKSSALCLKRKLIDDCPTKDSKSRHVEVGNVYLNLESRPSSDPYAHRCCIQSNLALDCVNYLKSTVPCRVVFYKEGSWCNFPEKTVASIVDAFKGDKSSVVVVMDDEPLLVDFLSMTLVNLRTRKQRSVAWLDGSGKWFYPSVLIDEEANESTKLNMSIVEGSTRGITQDKVLKSPSELVKQVVLETSPPPHIPCTVDMLRKRVVPVERGSEDFVFVQNLFLSGMGPFAMPNNILHIHHYSPKDITEHSTLEAFERQMRLTSEKRGTANARYGWLGCRKQDIVGILADGFVSIGKASGNAGIYLSPANRAFTSVGLCDVDEKGAQYMLLCRVILGNLGTIKPGSEEEFPSTEIHDSGADNCSNPSYYLIWNSHLSTHICLEYLISFRLAPVVQEYLGQKCIWFHPPPKQGIVDLSTLEPIICKSAAKGPTSPWVSFKLLFETIQDSISPVARELLFLHYEELKEKKITRKEMVKNMMIIVGKKLLMDSLTSLHYSELPRDFMYACDVSSVTLNPYLTQLLLLMHAVAFFADMFQLRKCHTSPPPSLWFKSSAKVDTDTTTATINSICIDTSSRNAPSTVLGHDSLAPSAMPERSEPIDSTCGCSPQVSVALKRQGSPIAHCVDSNEPFVPTMIPTVYTSVMRHNSVVSRPTLGNSSSLSMKGRSSVASSMAPMVLETLPSSIVPGDSSYVDAKGSDAATPCVSPEFQSSSMHCQSSARSMAPHRRVPGVAPHLRVPSKMSEVHVHSEMLQALRTSMMLQARNSSPKAVIPVSSIPTLPSRAPKQRATSTSRNKVKGHQPAGSNMIAKDISRLSLGVALKGPDSSANGAAKRLKASTRKNVMSSNSAARCGAKKMPIQGVDASGTVTVTVAADALVAPSAPNEKAR
ncbi:hypothetical protein ACP70R_042613 [Stipagrostis hirtigluma subsp. patula]